MAAPKDEKIVVKASTELLDAIDRAADARHQSRSEFVRSAVVDRLTASSFDMAAVIARHLANKDGAQ